METHTEAHTCIFKNHCGGNFCFELRALFGLGAVVQQCRYPDTLDLDLDFCFFFAMYLDFWFASFGTNIDISMPT